MTEIKQQHLIAVGAVATILFILGGSLLTYGLSQGDMLSESASTATTDIFDTPNVQVTPPASLEEVAAEIRDEYPELAQLLENPELGSVYKDFYIAYQNGGKETAIALARQRNILNSRDEIIMTLVLDTENTAPLITELETEQIIVNGHYENLINIAIPISLIEQQLQTEDPNLVVERISNLNHVIRLEFPKKALSQQTVTLGQGVPLTLATAWHNRGITGRGIKVGILDLGFADYKELLGSELPATVMVARFGDEAEFDSEPHGTACAEIVHEMAPDAELFLAYYDGSDVAMGQAVDWLIRQQVDIISNSTNSIGTTPLDGTGFSADLVNKAHRNGILWVNSAGNYAERHYRGRFQDTNGDNMHEFGSPDQQTLPFLASADYPTRIVLSWDDWQEVDQDYELILYTEEGKVLAKSEEPQSGEAGHEPIEGFLYTFEEEAIYLLGVENYDGLARGDAILDIFVEPSLMDPEFIVREHSLGSPADAENALAVGASYWFGDLPETYSSRGPTTDGRVKPDIAAPSDVDSQSYRPDSFPGTSAATPHVAGAAALVWQAFPDYEPAEIADFLENRAVDLGAPGPDNIFGSGRLNLGLSPDDPNISDAPLPPPIVVAELRATSTPRPPDALRPTFGTPRPLTTSSSDGTATIIGSVVVIGFCLVCLSAVLFLVLIVGVIVLLL